MGAMPEAATDGFIADDINDDCDMSTLFIALDTWLDPGGGPANCRPNWLELEEPKMSPEVPEPVPAAADKLDPAAAGGKIKDCPPMPAAVGG